MVGSVVEATAIWIGIVAGTLTSLVIVVPVVKRTANGIYDRFVRDVAESVARIERQVTPNGGNTDTLGDRMVKVQHKLGAEDDPAVS